MGKTNLLLFEHASGYALFNVREMEEVAVLSEQVNNSYQDPSIFHSICSLVAFQPFHDAVQALENANAISEGLMTTQLKLFLTSNFPKKAKKVVLGVSDAKLGGAIADDMGCSVSHIGAVPEMLRAIRHHFARLVGAATGDGNGSKSSVATKAQLGLGHSYSRAKVKFNVHRLDNMIIQSIALLDQLDKDVNTFSMRLREWYSYHFPELIKIVKDSMLNYAKCVLIVKDRTQFVAKDEAELTQLTTQMGEALMDTAKANAVVTAAKSSMGFELSFVDHMNMERFAKRVVDLIQYRHALTDYLHDKMQCVAPNLSTLIGDTIGARLISRAGSLTNLAKYPASTVQILGAEKALFRALKTRGKTPKYGLIYHSTYIGKAGPNRGRISRYLANKCSIASRIDCFTDHSTNIFGQKLKEQVEDRLKFYETGDLPPKNVDVMHDALAMVETEREQFIAIESKRQRKLDKKRKREEAVAAAAATLTGEGDDENEMPTKRAKVTEYADATEEQTGGEPPNVVTESFDKENVDVNMIANVSANGDVGVDMSRDSVKKRKKAKKDAIDVSLDKNLATNGCNVAIAIDIDTPTNEQRKTDDATLNGANGDLDTLSEPSSGQKKSKKKKSLMTEDKSMGHHTVIESDVCDADNVECSTVADSAKKKKKHKSGDAVSIALDVMNSIVDNENNVSSDVTLNVSCDADLSTSMDSAKKKKKKQKKVKQVSVQGNDDIDSPLNVASSINQVENDSELATVSVDIDDDVTNVSALVDSAKKKKKKKKSECI